jgi:hypothetical protein
MVDRISDQPPGVAIPAGAYPAILPDTVHTGYVITRSDESGYGNEGGRRKVVLWSREPWSEAWQAKESELPGARFMSGVTSGNP